MRFLLIHTDFYVFSFFFARKFRTDQIVVEMYAFTVHRSAGGHTTHVSSIVVAQ